MLLEVGDVRETLWAVRALVWFFPSVKTFMAFQVRKLGEGVVAGVADIWLFTTVDPLVFLKRRILSELLSARF